MQEGVTTEGVQHAICSGSPYGGREHSAAEREAACLRYEQMTGESVPRATSETPLFLVSDIVLSGVLLIAIVWYIFHKKKTQKVAAQKH